MTRAAVAAAALFALALPATAVAQVPPAPTPAPAPPAPAPPPAPATGALVTSAQGTLSGVALKGRSFTVRVSVKPYVASEKLVLRVYRGKRKIRVRLLTPKPAAGGTVGVAKLKVKSRVARTLVIKAVHKATPALATLRAKTLRVKVLRPAAGYGTRGPIVRLLQSRLAALHYAVSASGVYDSGTGNAVMAFRKLTGMSRTFVASEQVFTALLAGRGAFHVRHPGDGHHVEARLNQQVLALIDAGKVVRIYPTSSGKPSTPTVQGKFRVYSKTPGTNAKGMLDSNYFIRGYAIHGYMSVPPYNASHGCLRVPLQNAQTIYDWLRLGDVVWVEP